MEHTYVLIVNHKAYIVALVNTELASGRFQMYDFSRNYVRGKKYESREEFEQGLDRLCQDGVIDTWGKITLEV